MTLDVQTIVASKLSKHIAASPEQTSLQPAQRLQDLQLDSLALLETVYELEEHFDISVETEGLSRLATVSDLVTAVENSLRQAGKACSGSDVGQC